MYPTSPICVSAISICRDSCSATLSEASLSQEPIEHKSLRSFWLALALGLVVLAAAISLPFRAVVITIIQFPAHLLAGVLPGNEPQADIVALGHLLKWMGFLLAPIALLPLLALPMALLSQRLLAIATAVLKTIEVPARMIVKWTGEATKWLTVALVFIVVTVVIQRYVFGTAFAKLQEAILYLHACMFLFALAYTLQRDGHVRVDVLLNRFGTRARAVIDLISMYGLVALSAITILMTSRGYVSMSWRVLEKSAETSGLPIVFLLKTMIPIAAGLLLLQAFAGSCEAARRFLANEQAPR
jgi:TRAP-type mannitol/chloroaromatic compound transport system permease small subunit